MENILVDKWPENKEEIYDYKQWVPKEWVTGEPITKEKLQNLDNGIAVLATQMDALLKEIKIDPSTIILNGTRLDIIQKWITAAEDGTYDLTKGSIAARLASIDTLNTQQNNKLNAIMSEIGGTGNDGTNTTYGGTSRIDSITTEIWGSNTTSGTSRIDKNENKITAIAAELGGTAPDGNSTIYGGTTRLDNVITKTSSIATEIWGSDTTSGDSRIDALESTSLSYGTRLTNIETKNTAQDNKLAAIMNELGGTGNDGSSTNYGGTSRLDTVITEVWNSNTTSGNSRIDNIETHNTSVDKAIAAIKNEIGGTYIEDNGFTDSRIDNLQTIVGSGALNDAYANLTDAVKAIIETDNFGKASQNFETVKIIVKEIWGKDYEEAVLTDDSLIDSLNARLSSLSDLHSQTQNRVATLEENITRIPIEMYVATNSTASDTIILDAVPRDKSIFFVAIPLGTLGQENLKLQTPDIQFADEIGQQPTSITLKKNYADPVIVKYPKNSIISIYRKDERDSNGNITSSNAYIVNMTKIL